MSMSPVPRKRNVLLAGDVTEVSVDAPSEQIDLILSLANMWQPWRGIIGMKYDICSPIGPIEHRGEDEQDGDGAQRVELGEERGRLQVDQGEDNNDQEEGNLSMSSLSSYHHYGR